MQINWTLLCTNVLSPLSNKTCHSVNPLMLLHLTLPFLFCVRKYFNSLNFIWSYPVFHFKTNPQHTHLTYLTYNKRAASDRSMCSVWEYIHTRVVPHLSVLALAVPTWVQVADTCAQRGGNGVAGLPVILWNAVVYSIHLLHEALVQLQGNETDKWGSEPGMARESAAICLCSFWKGVIRGKPFFFRQEKSRKRIFRREKCSGIIFSWLKSIWSQCAGIHWRLEVIKLKRKKTKLLLFYSSLVKL